ncbi:MAG TPA: DUF1207 domain-containing protein [Gemmatimonadales bacterium]|nr:DUF1207 domain-containing protein [Gemmatimonadales bacterium]
MSSIRTAVVAVLCGAGQALPLSAQQRVLPAVPRYELPAASPRVHAIVGRLLSAQRGDSRFGSDTEAEVALGENFPLLALRGGRHPIALGFGSQVYARFSLSDSKSSLISHDWVVGVNATAALGRWDMTVELYHESSHLGDEYGDRFDVSRLDWTREVGALWAAYNSGDWRLTAGASYVLIDQLDLSPPGFALAVDWRGRSLGRMLDGQIRPLAGIYTEATAATDWRVSTSAKFGLALPSGSGHEVGISIIAHDGLSTQRQFYRSESRYLGMEVRFDL